MAIYPKRRKVLAGRFGFNSEMIKEGLENGKLDAISGGVSALGEGISNIGSKDLGYGVMHKGVGANTVGEGLKMAGAGFQLGKNFGAPGAIIGTAAGLVGGLTKGFIEGKSEKDKAKKLFTSEMSNSINENNKKSRSNYAGLSSYSPRSYAKGGSVRSVIMGGKLHKEGGNPIVHGKTGEKLAETEREELLLSAEHTDQVEHFIKVYDEKKDQQTLVELGMLMRDILTKHTIDNSGIYGAE